ncbi:MAG: hypothetical protein K2G38_03685, partial [Clostridia bacterium]|nr:hypothetical protein [Clostridia bacterium]
MKKMKGRKILTALLAAACAIILCVSFGLLSGLGGLNSKTAVAASTTIGEIAPGTGKDTFDGEKLAELYDAILGSDYKYIGTYDKVKKKIDDDGQAVAGSGVSTKALTAADLGEIYVTFGGKDWQVVYLTTKGNDVIVDLMLKNSGGSSVFASGGGYTTWNNTTYPVISNLYSTSYIRSVTVGTGTTYYNFPTTSTTTNYSVGTAAASGTYSRYLSGDLSSYIEAPSAIDYQEKESWVELSGESGPNYNVAFNLPSDAYGTPTAENYYQGSAANNPQNDRPNVNTNYTSSAKPSVNSSGGAISISANPKANYTDWQNDKVWLPSLTEAYMWGVENSGETWLRSGGSDSAAYAYYLTAAGGDYGPTVSTALAVR